MKSSKHITVTLMLIVNFFTIHFSFSQVVWNPGVYALTSVNKPPIDTNIYQNPDFTGLALRASWHILEPTEGNFNWAILDNDIANAAAAGKKVSIFLQPFVNLSNVEGTPAWVFNSGAQVFYFQDLYPSSPTYLDTFRMPVPWDSIFLSKLHNLITAFGNKYGSNTTVAYTRGSSENVTYGWNMPKKDINGLGWDAYGYTSDTMIYACKKSLDWFMAGFPNTPHWGEVGVISFETSVTGNSQTYVTEKYADYGFATYPDRFGIWREDVSNCTFNPPVQGQTPHQDMWHIMWSHPCYVGAQAARPATSLASLNSCNTQPNTADTLLKALIDKALAYKMHYLEIYQTDFVPSLSGVIKYAQDSLKNICALVLTSTNELINPSAILSQLYPNPTSGNTTLEFSLNEATFTNIEIVNLLGEKVLTVLDGNFSSGKHSMSFDAGELENGVYFINIKTNSGTFSKKLTVTK